MVHQSKIVFYCDKSIKEAEQRLKEFQLVINVPQVQLQIEPSELGYFIFSPIGLFNRLILYRGNSGNEIAEKIQVLNNLINNAQINLRSFEMVGEMRVYAELNT